MCTIRWSEREEHTVRPAHVGPNHFSLIIFIKFLWSLLCDSLSLFLPTKRKGESLAPEIVNIISEAQWGTSRIIQRSKNVLISSGASNRKIKTSLNLNSGLQRCRNSKWVNHLNVPLQRSLTELFRLLDGSRNPRTTLRGTDTSDQPASVRPLLTYGTLLKSPIADCICFKLHSSCFGLLMSEEERLTLFFLPPVIFKY